MCYMVSLGEVQICTQWQTEEECGGCLGHYPVHNQETSESTVSASTPLALSEL